MASPDDSVGPMGPYNSPNDESRSSKFDFQPLSPASHRHQSGYLCTNSTPSMSKTADTSPILTKKVSTGHPQTVRDLMPRFAYPSPPSTGSTSKRTVPLPQLTCSGGLDPSLFSTAQAGGILDSPLILRSPQTPLSPPPTILTPTLALPIEGDHPIAQVNPEADAGPSTFEGAHSDVANSTPQLLSPLSPEWESNKIDGPSDMMVLSPTSEESVLLSDNPFDFPAEGQRDHYDSQFAQDTSCCRPILPPLEIPNSSLDKDTAWDPPPMDVDSEQPLKPPPSPMMGFGRQLASPTYGHFQTFEDDLRAFPHPITPSMHSPGLVSSPLPLPSLELDFDYDNMSDFSMSPSSPSRRSYSSLPELDADDDDMFSPTSSDGSRTRSNSLSKTLLSLPGADTDDDLLLSTDFADYADPNFVPEPMSVIPSSPFLDMSHLHHSLLLDDVNDVPMPRSPSPDAYDLDLDLDAAMSLGSEDPDIAKLLELRRRSQAAERSARQVEQVLLDDSYAYTPGQGGSGQVGEMRAEARRSRKKEKERGKEISTMLRLKLTGSGNKGPATLQSQEEHAQAEMQMPSSSRASTSTSAGKPQSRSNSKSSMRGRKQISSMEQLVAWMNLRRHESRVRPMARSTRMSQLRAMTPDGEVPSPRSSVTRSPLSATVVAPMDEDDDDDDGTDRDDPAMDLSEDREHDKRTLDY